MNKSTIATILGVATLGLIRTPLGSHNKKYTPKSISMLYKAGIKMKSETSILDFSKIPEKDALIIKGINLMGWKNLSEVPIGIERFENLNMLNLDGKIDNIDKICELTKLKSIYLRLDNLEHIPPCIGNLTNLTTLDVSSKKIISIPKEIGKLVNLTELSFRMSENLKYLPLEIGDLKNLRSVDLYGTSLVMPTNRVLKYWIKNLKPNVFQGIMRHIEKPSSQLRRF